MRGDAVEAFLFGVTAGVLLTGFGITKIGKWRASGQRVFEAELDGMAIRIGVVPDPGPRWEVYTEAELDLADCDWN